MATIRYHGVYRTRNATATMALATVAQEENRFPPSIQYKGASYTLYNIVQVSTPSQIKTFKEYCDQNNIETDVII